jgi:TubC N-terminal docking domain
MTATQLLNELTELGITLTPLGDTLTVSPKSKLTPELVTALKSEKRALLALLNPTRTENDEDCPKHWLHIPRLPPKGQQVITESDNGQGLRYRVRLFEKWYIVRFCPHISETTVEVACTKPKRRMFADLNEFYRWAWAETFYADLTFKPLN